jgi:hypothetical protein
VVFNHFGSVLVVNSTLTGNAAQGGTGGFGGGGGGAGLGGALFNLDGAVTVESSTLAGNRATGGDPGAVAGQPGQGRGGALFNHFQDDGVGNDLAVTMVTAATLTIEDSILADSVDAPEDCFNNDVAASVALQGANLIESNGAAPNACGAPPITSNPVLGPLQDNGGPTHTLAISGASPAFGAAAACPPPATDQRGVARPQGAACDLGAFELASTVDLGDAPDPSYPTLLASDGARHYPSPLHLGACVDTESDGQQTATAAGDDTDVGTALGACAVAGDDEDGVTFTSGVFQGGSLAQVSVVASAAGLLDAWLDFDGDGDWEAGEQIFTSEPLVAGANPLSFPVPAGALLGATDDDAGLGDGHRHRRHRLLAHGLRAHGRHDGGVRQATARGRMNGFLAAGGAESSCRAGVLSFTTGS